MSWSIRPMLERNTGLEQGIIMNARLARCSLLLVCLASFVLVSGAQEPAKPKPVLSEAVLKELVGELERLQRLTDQDKGTNYPVASSQIAYYLIRGVQAENPELVPAAKVQAMNLPPNRRGSKRRVAAVANGVRTALYEWPLQDKSGNILFRRAELYTLESGVWSLAGMGSVVVSSR